MGDINFTSNGFEFDQLAGKYKNFYAPCFSVSVDGQDLLTNGVGITNVKVDTSIEKADAFSFKIVNAYDPVSRDFNWLDQYFAIGGSVEIKMGYTDVLETVFVGLITSVKFDLAQGDSPTMVVGGMDAGFLMTKGVKSRSWINKKHSDVARLVAGEYSLSVEVDDTTISHVIVEQSRTNDYQFLTSLAKENNFEFFIAGQKAYFRKPHQDTTPVVTLEGGKNLLSLNVNVDAGGQSPQIVVRYHDTKTGEHFEGAAEAVTTLGSGSRTGPDKLKEICGSSVIDYKYTKVSSSEEAVAKATADLNATAMRFVTGGGESIGIPEIRAGKYIKVAGAGSWLNTVYYITSATHTVNDSGYSTSFNIGGNAI